MKIEVTPGFEKSMERLFSMNPIYCVPRWIKDRYYLMKYAYQRVRRGYDDRMVFSFYDEMGALCIKALTSLRDDCKTGYPTRFEGRKDWDGILTKIINGLKAAERISDNDFFDKVPLPKGTTRKDIFGEEVHHKLVINEKRKKQLEDEFSEGMDLFKKHFFSLWD